MELLVSENDSGFIAIPRSLEDDPYFQSLTFSERYIVIDLISRTEWKERQVLIRGELRTIKPGQFVCTVRGLHEKYNQHFKSLDGFQKFLHKIQNLKIIILEKCGHSGGHQKTIITITHPGICETNFGNKRSSQRSSSGHRAVIDIYKEPLEPLKPFKKEKRKKEKIEKKEETEKKAYREFVHLTPDQFEKLVQENSPSIVEEMLNILDSYKGSTGKIYDSDYHTMAKGGWVYKKLKETPAGTGISSSAKVDRRTKNQDGTPVTSPADELF
jgi:hypothetical protein